MTQAARGQLDREGNALQPGADGGDCRGVVRVQLERRRDPLGGLNEERDRVEARQGGDVRQPSRVRQRERWDVVGPLTSQPQPLPACDQHRDSRAARQQLRHRGRGVDDVLHVVED